MTTCTCSKGYPARGERHITYTDDQCPTHGFEAWLMSKDAPVRSEGLPTEDVSVKPCEKCNGTGARHVAGEPVWSEPCEKCSGEAVVCVKVEWLSGCCQAPPHPMTPDVGESNPTGACGRCRDNCVFERSEV
jgi:hypothetical protein